METTTTLILVFSFITVVCCVYLVYYWYSGYKKDKIDVLVSEINRTHRFMSDLGKNNQNNIMNLEKNMNMLHKTTQNFEDRIKVAVTELRDMAASNITPDNINTKNIRFADRFDIKHIIRNTSMENSNGENWIQVSPLNSNEPGGGIIVNKFRSLQSSELNGPTTVNGPTRFNDDVKVAGSMILEGNNKWIFHTPEDGKTSMYLAAFSNNTWDWDRQYSFANDGTFRASGGLATKGGKSSLNPNRSDTVFSAQDGKNYIRGDTRVDGNLEMTGTMRFNRKDPGSMVEKSYSDTERYGMGQYANGTLRMYTGIGNSNSSVNLSIAGSNNTFFDVLKVMTNKNVDVNGPLNVNSGLNTRSLNILSEDKTRNLRVVPGKTPADIVDIYSGAGAQEKKIAGFKADGSFCLGNVCMREKQGSLEVCNANGNLCKKVTLQA